MTSLRGTRTPGRDSYRIVIVDDHALFADAMELSLSLAGYDALTLEPGRARSPDGLVSDVLRLQPRLVLLDIDLGRVTDGLELISPLARGGVDVLVLTACCHRGTWGDALHRGARRVMSKSSALPEVLTVVRRLHQGLAVLSVDQRQELLRRRHELRARQAELRARFEATPVQPDGLREPTGDGGGDETCPEHA